MLKLQTVSGGACCSGNTAFSTISLESLLGFVVNSIEFREILFFNVGMAGLLSSLE